MAFPPRRLQSVRTPGSSVAVVCLTADRDEATIVGHDLAARMRSIGINTPVTLWADETR